MNTENGLEVARKLYLGIVKGTFTRHCVEGRIPSAQIAMLTDITMVRYDAEIFRAINSQPATGHTDIQPTKPNE